MRGLSRRDFLLVAISTAVAPVVGAGGADELELRVIDLEIEVPRLLFFPECRRRAEGYCKVRPVRVETLSLDPRGSRVVVHFSHGRDLVLDAGTSYTTSALEPMRERVVLKSLAAWVIAGAARLAQRVPSSSFEALQEQSVLEAVTPGSLYELVAELQRNRAASTVAWDASGSRFRVR